MTFYIKYNFVGTPRKFIIAKLSLIFSLVLIEDLVATIYDLTMINLRGVS